MKNFIKFCAIVIFANVILIFCVDKIICSSYKIAYVYDMGYISFPDRDWNYVNTRYLEELSRSLSEKNPHLKIFVTATRETIPVKIVVKDGLEPLSDTDGKMISAITSQWIDEIPTANL